VYGLSNPQVLIPIVQAQGRKHVRSGVKNEDYATVQRALLWTLRQRLGTAFGPENEAAWIKAYSVLAEAMKSPA
jgi:hemoglobin-like flavoprotein